MKTRRISAVLAAAVLLALALASCNLNPVVSIDQRVSNFASDLNSNRSNAYQDFHPDQTTMYQTLANSTFTFDSYFPAGSPSYAFQITDESSPSTGVFVTIVGAPSGYGSNIYLKLIMATYKDTDWRIVQLSRSAIAGSFGSAIIY
ncbi:MAG: hypothetical protein ACLQCB_11235 [Spirochaetia bacterium]